MVSNSTAPLNLVKLISLLILSGLVGCASNPPDLRHASDESIGTTESQAPTQVRAGRALAIAEDMVGVPYRYGGASPRGFDCSGLVYYAFGQAGIEIPRTTTEQYHRSKQVKLSDLEPGDLIFFRISREKVSHVGIYAGNDRFIHAPARGKTVSYATLDDEYWRDRIIGAGRL